MAYFCRKVLAFCLALLLLFDGFSSVSAFSPPAKIAGGLISNGITMLLRLAWSLKSTTKTAISGRSMMKFEGGYAVETVFDGSKLGIYPYSVELLPSGELLILDSANSNLYRISSSLSRYTRAKLVAGSADGYSGHVDGRHREARMNRPKGIAVDDKGNIYVADTFNMVIRKISDTGVTTIAGRKGSRGGKHVDGRSEEAKFSNDFDVVYLRSSCSLLVVDRGHRAIREIRLNFDDCAYHYETSLPLGIAVLLAAVFFGYMLALLQSRLGSMASPYDEWSTEPTISAHPYQKSPKFTRQPLIPFEEEQEKQEEGLKPYVGRLFTNAGSFAAETFQCLIPYLKKKPPTEYQTVSHYHYDQGSAWPLQETFKVPKGDEPPPIESLSPTPRKTYPFMHNDADETRRQLRQSRVSYDRQRQKKYEHRHQQRSSASRTYVEHNSERAEEVVFGPVQVQEGWPKPDCSYSRQHVRYRMGSNGGY